MAVLKVIQELLSTPSILVGLMALIGLCLQKKPVEDVVKGTREFLPFRTDRYLM